MAKTVKVIKENSKGRNVRFKDINTGKEMTRTQFVKQIENGKYPGYHVKNCENGDFPASNPDNKIKNNLG